jgi:DNA repair protein SbcD/Mre11
MPRLLHLADLHLGWRARDMSEVQARVRRERRDDLLVRAVDLALEERVDVVVVAGDLFETFDPEPTLVEWALRHLERLPAAGIELVTVPGNHDELTYAGSVYRTYAERWPGHLVTSPMPSKVATLDLDGGPLHVYGVAYVGGVTDVRGVAAALPSPSGEGVHVFVAHGTLLSPGAALAAGERSLPLDRAALERAGYDYVALGHVHAPGASRLGAAWAVYPGCVGGKGLDDLGSRHWTVVDLAPSGASVREVPAKVQPLRHVTLDVSGRDDEGAVSDAIMALADSDALVRVRLVGALAAPLSAEALEERCAPGFFQLEVRDETTAVSGALLEAWAASPTVRGAFVRRLQRRLAAAEGDADRALATRALLAGLDALRERR